MNVPIELFGRDHWSTLLYVETRCVDYGGNLQRENMRCDPKRHPQFAHTNDGSRYVTRLRVPHPMPIETLRALAVEGGNITNLPDHDDWDCVDDLAAAGLLENIGTGANPKFRLTDKGWAFASRLRRWRAEKKAVAEFHPGVAAEG